MVWSMVAQQDGPLVLTGLIFIVTLGTILPAAAHALSRQPDGDTAPLVARLAVGILAGWVSVAFFANWSVVLEDFGLGDVPGRDLQAVILLGAAGLTAAAMILRTRGALAYASTVGWALVAIAIANIGRDEAAPAWTASILAGALAILVWAARRTRTRA